MVFALKKKGMGKMSKKKIQKKRYAYLKIDKEVKEPKKPDVVRQKKGMKKEKRIRRVSRVVKMSPPTRHGVSGDLHVDQDKGQVGVAWWLVGGP